MSNLRSRLSRAIDYLCLAVLLCACLASSAAAAVYAATPATLAGLFARAQGGDVLSLAGGDYAAGDFYGRFPASAPVTLRAADQANPPRFATLSVKAASGLVFEGVRVDFKPTATTVTWSWAVRIEDSDHVTFRGLKALGGLAVSGLAEDGSGTDVGGNIIGRPTGYGVLVQSAADVLIDGGEVASFYKGVVLNRTLRTTVRGLEVHGNRTTAIVGADNTDLTIEGNWLHSAHPWRWGNGDHADLLALWSNAGQATPNARVKILGNRMEQLEGEAILGMWAMGSAAAPFTDLEIRSNLIVVNNLQGILINNTHGRAIAGNQLYRASPGDAGQSPTILLRENTTGISLDANRVGAPISDLSGGINPASATVLVQGDANVYSAPPAPVPPSPAPTPAPTPLPAPTPAPAPLPDIVVKLLPGQTVATSKPGKTYKPKAGQRAIFISPN